MKVVFMGTPDFAVGALKAIWEAGYEICGVVTQPDKPKGRSKELQMTPVKEFALEKGIEVFQPVRIRKPENVEKLASWNADIFVVAAFGQILSQEILDMPKFGCINIHASLLPQYRGAAPIQWSIINGDAVTGVTIQQMNAGVDTGDILFTEEIPVDPRDTYATLYDKLELLGAQMIVPALENIEKGNVNPVPQNEAESSHVSMIDKAMGKIDFSRPACEIERLIRGLNPWPSAYTVCRGKTMKIWESFLCEETVNGEPGTIHSVAKDAIYVNTGEGVLKVTELQLEGKKRMQVKDFLLGFRIEKGETLGC